MAVYPKGYFDKSRKPDNQQDGERPYSLGATIPLNPPTPSVDGNKELDEIFNQCGVISDNGKYYPKPDKLKAKIQALLQQTALEARLDELDRVMEQAHSNVLSAYFEKRIEQLTKPATLTNEKSGDD